MPPYDNPAARRRSQSVRVDAATNDVILRLHETDIVRVRPNGDVLLSTGGWATRKTLNSMNDALELFDMYVQSIIANVNAGDWLVYDDDGSVHPYRCTRESFQTTIAGRGPSAHLRCGWLAEAYNVRYTPGAPARALQPRVAPQAQPRIVSGPPAPGRAAGAGAPSGGAPAAASQAPAPSASRPASGSWAHIAKAPTTAGPPAGRLTGPGAPAAAAAAAGGGWPGLPGSAPAPAPAGPAAANGGGSYAALKQARRLLDARQQQPQQQQQHAPPAAQQFAPQQPCVPPKPVAEQLADQMQQLGIDADEDDSTICVVCMELPRQIVLVPCGHLALCPDCFHRIMPRDKPGQRECPMCCQQVDSHVQIEAAVAVE